MKLASSVFESDSSARAEAAMAAVAGGGEDSVSVEAREFSVFYREKEAVKKVGLQIPAGQVTAIIGPSGCGKSTLLRAINRMNELLPGARVTGEVALRKRSVERREVVRDTVRRQDVDVETIQEVPKAGPDRLN